MSFNAPAVLLCYFDRRMGSPQWSDVGMWLQTVMLLLREEGLDTCPQEFLSMHAKLIKDSWCLALFLTKELTRVPYLMNYWIQKYDQ